MGVSSTIGGFLSLSPGKDTVTHSTIPKIAPAVPARDRRQAFIITVIG